MLADLNLALLEADVRRYASQPSFRHRCWYVEHHLEVVSRPCDELTPRYPAADLALVGALVWLHDVEKMHDQGREHDPELPGTRQLLSALDQGAATTERLCALLVTFNAKTELVAAPIEVQIVSSADAASHLVGPFFALYWHENPTMSVAELQRENLRKLLVDWRLKVTLPEVREAFAERHRLALELGGIVPAQFL